jgi:DNA-directed RNA polymerase alpha subunit
MLGKTVEVSPGSVIITLPDGSHELLTAERFEAEYDLTMEKASRYGGDALDLRSIPILEKRGINDAKDLLELSREELLAIPYITIGRVDRIIAEAKRCLGQ